MDYLSVTCDNTTYFVGKNGIAVVAFPFFEVVGECDANAFSLQIVLGVDAASIIKHHKTLTQCLGRIVIDGTLILHQLLPPLRVLVVNTEQGFVGTLPFVGFRNVCIRPCHTNIQRFSYSLIARTMSTDVGHPVLILIFRNAVVPVPCPVNAGRKATQLVHIPTVVFIA